MSNIKKIDSDEAQIQRHLKECKNFLYDGRPLLVAEVSKIHTFKTQTGDFKDGNLQYTGLIELYVYVNVPENNKCSQIYEMMGTANQAEDGEVELTTPVYLSNSSY